ncbi:MAG: WYL domain-containing protein [Actinomycetaceae bacterium]|nr:WYL domain-containing protein [Actinomycetaceae bacterium]
MAGNAIVQTNAMLVYLHDQGGSASLSELARHFGLTWRRVLDLLWSASLVEIDGHVDSYSLVLPSRPGQEDDEEETTGDSLVSFYAGRGDIPELALMLDEVIALVAVIDSISELTPPGEAAAALARLRDKLEDACGAAGFTGALWPPPAPIIDERAMAELDTALSGGSWVEFDYHRPGRDLTEDISHPRVLPLQIRSAVNPLLVAWSEDGIRTYRLDRIGHVRAQDAASRADRSAARQAAQEEGPWQIEGTRVTLTVTSFGRWIAQALPGATSRRRDELTEVTFTSRSDEFLATLLIQLGTAVVDIEPADVRDRLATRFARLLEVSP